MAKPIPGTPYTIIPDDTLTRISGLAYGVPSRWPEIWRANETRLRSGDPHLIYPGEVINIPVLPERKQIKQELPDKEYDDITILIDDKEIPFDTVNVFRLMDTCADGFILSSSEQIVKPYRWNNTKAYVGGVLIVTGRIYDIEVTLTKDSRSYNYYGFSSTIDLVDSNLKTKYEQNKVDLEQVAKLLTEEKVLFPFGPGGKFDRATAESSETKFDFLARLAKQRKLLVTSTNKGELLFTRTDTTTKVGSLIEGYPPVFEFTGSFKGRERFGAYKGIRQTRGKSKSAVSIDNRVPLSRFKTFNVEDSQGGSLQDIVDWQRSKQLVSSLSMPITVDGWYAPDGNLWQENTIVFLQSEALFVPKGFEFIIRSVEYLLDGQGGRTVLELVPPQVYTGEEIKEPWF